ncbi:DUF4199 domain-containing protein [Olleya sp. AH-315-F22]|nr:DUF4199 domain-containing protein [Olleya sp. AH-315-F22]
MKKIALPVRFGIAISGSLIAYFLILSLFNLHTSPSFSLFNGVITAFGLYETIKSYKLRQGNKFNYTNGFIAGIISGFVATIIFTIFFAFYATEIDANFLNKLLEGYSRNYHVRIGLVVFTVAIMGFATTVVLTLAFMQLFKNSRNIPQNQ